ncbi:MAG: glycoside hydrolase family 13 protein [Streptomycetaceae bacterium]|nr:MAG: glycoside hydrolase family 13 protein [Streptomycetaceae bacterium]
MKNQPHHDGSQLYVSNISPAIGEKVTLKVRVPNNYVFEKVMLRIYHDGEPRIFELKEGRKGKKETWYQITVEILNLQNYYRFAFIGQNKYEWLNAKGLFDYDVHSNSDFQLVAIADNPEWIKSSVFYQIFPDRFARSGKVNIVPEWAYPREWNLLPRGRSKFTGQELYGGDLYGVSEHLDHITDLGVNGIYFTPLFPARSNHRYDASSFDVIDPILGGDAAFQSLIKIAKKKSIRILGDLTSNHCGAGHEWLAKAKKDKKSKERSYFYWDKSIKWGYLGWFGLESLPKLNFSSKSLRKVMYEGKNSIVKKWISPKYGMAGWRIDVGNMTGRQGVENHHTEVMQGIRNAMNKVNSQTWLVAENGDFEASDLNGLGWQGAMNYQGFMRPFWNWINRNPEITGGFQGLPFAMPKINGRQLVASMQEFNSSIPWRSLTASMMLLDSHDTARFRTVVMGDRNAHLAAMTMMLTYPGVPSIFAGDEIGLEGSWGEDARRTINWSDKSGWDLEFFSEVRNLIKLRRNQDALINGGLRWVVVEDDYLVYLRESKKQSILVFVSRGPVKATIDLNSFGYTVIKTLYGQVVEGEIFSVDSAHSTQGIWIVE